MKLLIAVLLSVPAFGAITGGQVISSSCATGSCTSLTTFTVSITATTLHDYIYICTGNDGGQAISSFTDSASQSYTLDIAPSAWNFGSRVVKCFYNSDSAASVTSLTVTMGTGANMIMIGKIYAGAATSSSIDGTAVTNSGAAPIGGCTPSGDCALASTTAAAAGELGIAVCGNNSGGTISAHSGSSFSSVGTQALASTWRLSVFDFLTTSGSGSVSMQCDFSSNQGAAGIGITLVKAAGAAASPITRRFVGIGR